MKPISFILNIYFPSQNPYGSENEGSDYTAIWFFLPFIIAIGYVIYKRYFNSEIKVEGFDYDSSLSRDNLMKAYIFLAAEIIKSDTSHSTEKIVYMNTYFIKHFQESNYQYKEILVDAYRNPAPPWKVATWLQYHLNQPQRLQVMYFLAGLSMVDGNIQGFEMRILSNISEILELTPKEFQSIIGMYEQQEQKRQSKSTYTPRKTRLKIACEILGVSEFADIVEIKKAYRQLVKIHHPDRFYNESEGQQKIAQERFLKIQEAYETIEKLK